MFKITYLEFYITNVCNLNCNNCNRFNNFNFSGHSTWNQYQPDIEKWAKILDPSKIGILGGEPMLNPDFMLWVKNIADLWPLSKITIITNGTQLKKWPKLYELLVQYQGRIVVEVTCHNVDTQDQILTDIRNITQGSLKERWIVDPQQVWINSYNSIKDPSWPVCDTPLNFFNLPDWIQQECQNIHDFDFDSWMRNNPPQQFVDQNKTVFIFNMADSFNNSTVNYNPLLHSV